MKQQRENYHFTHLLSQRIKIKNNNKYKLATQNSSFTTLLVFRTLAEVRKLEFLGYNFLHDSKVIISTNTVIFQAGNWA